MANNVFLRLCQQREAIIRDLQVVSETPFKNIGFGSSALRRQKRGGSSDFPTKKAKNKITEPGDNSFTLEEHKPVRKQTKNICINIEKLVTPNIIETHIEFSQTTPHNVAEDSPCCKVS